MATYFFETITDAQAAAYTAADNLVFGQTGETARLTTVIFNAAAATSPRATWVATRSTARVRPARARCWAVKATTASLAAAAMTS